MKLNIKTILLLGAGGFILYKMVSKSAPPQPRTSQPAPQQPRLGPSQEEIAKWNEEHPGVPYNYGVIG